VAIPLPEAGPAIDRTRSVGTASCIAHDIHPLDAPRAASRDAFDFLAALTAGRSRRLNESVRLACRGLGDLSCAPLEPRLSGGSPSARGVGRRQRSR